MVDSFTQVSSQGYGSRLMESIKGVLIGLLMFAVSFPLIFWNEGRAIHTARGLEEGQGAVVDVKTEAVDAANEKKLVHFTGDTKTGETLADPLFGVTAPAIRLVRDAKMYQWTEKEEKRTVEKIGGSKETTTVYTYERAWKDQLVKSAAFKAPNAPSENRNPEKLLVDQGEWSAREVSVGAYRLPSELVSEINTFEAEPVTGDGADVQAPPGVRVRVADGGFYLGDDPANPKVGDTKVSFRVVKPGPVSVIAMQMGNTLGAYRTHADTKLEILKTGSHSAQEMFQAELAANAALTWVLRGVGFFLMFIGIYSVFRPIVMLVNVLPFLGDMLGFGLGLFSAMISAALTMLTIAIGWLFYRPLVGVPLVLASVGLIVWMKTAGSKKKAETETAAAPVA